MPHLKTALVCCALFMVQGCATPSASTPSMDVASPAVGADSEEVEAAPGSSQTDYYAEGWAAGRKLYLGGMWFDNDAEAWDHCSALVDFTVFSGYQADDGQQTEMTQGCVDALMRPRG